MRALRHHAAAALSRTDSSKGFAAGLPAAARAPRRRSCSGSRFAAERIPASRAGSFGITARSARNARGMEICAASATGTAAGAAASTAPSATLPSQPVSRSSSPGSAVCQSRFAAGWSRLDSGYPTPWTMPKDPFSSRARQDAMAGWRPRESSIRSTSRPVSRKLARRRAYASSA